MPTAHQLLRYWRVKKVPTNNTAALSGNPQLKGTCIRLRIVKPKKPNSAQRKVVKVRLSTRRQILAYIPGQGHNIQEFSSVLVCGGRANDLPGVRYSLVKGVYDFAWQEKYFRNKKRSKYGVPSHKKK